MNRVSPTEVWNRVSMNVYRFINRSIGVPPDLRDSKIAFFMEETTNSVFITIFSSFPPPNSITLLLPIICDLQLFNEQTVSILFFHGIILTQIYNKSNEIPTYSLPFRFSNPKDFSWERCESGVHPPFSLPVTAGGILSLLYRLLSSATCSNIYSAEGKLTRGMTWYHEETNPLSRERRKKAPRLLCIPIETWNKSELPLRTKETSWNNIWDARFFLRE